MAEVRGFGSIWVDAEGNNRSVLERVDPATNKIVSRTNLGLGPAGGGSPLPDPLAVGSGSVWVSNYFRNNVDRVDPTSGKIIARIATGRSPSGVAATDGQIFVANANDGTLVRINPKSQRVDKRLRIGGPGPNGFGTTFPQPAVFRHSIWIVVQATHQVVQINPRSMVVTHRYNVAATAGCGFLAPAPHGFWMIATSCANELDRYDTATRKVVEHISVANACMANANVVGDFLYTAQSTNNAAAGTCSPGFIVKRDLRTGRPIAQRRVGRFAFYVLAADRSLWATDITDNTIVRLKRF